MDESYLKILQMVQDGQLSAAEAEEIIVAMEAGEPTEAPAGAPPPAAPPDEAEPAPPAGAPTLWRRIWIYPLTAGFLVLAAGGIWTGSLIQGGEALGWLACAIPLLLFGALVALLAWWSAGARWLHLYVRDPEKTLRLSLPLPLRFTAWVLRVIRPWSPRLRDTAVDELILALAEVDTQGNVLSVEVDEEEDGEEVRVYIG
jgi:hypothetical protein